MICGQQRAENPEDAGKFYSLLPGHYSTVVNIRNRSECEGKIDKRFNLAIPEGFLQPGGMIDIDEHEIKPELAFAVDCRDLASRSETLNGVVAGGFFFDGFLELHSTRPLTLSGVHTCLDLDQRQSPSIDVENAISQQDLIAPDNQCTAACPPMGGWYVDGAGRCARPVGASALPDQERLDPFGNGFYIYQGGLYESTAPDCQ